MLSKSACQALSFNGGFHPLLSTGPHRAGSIPQAMCGLMKMRPGKAPAAASEFAQRMDVLYNCRPATY
jgi:hypothetical protein